MSPDDIKLADEVMKEYVQLYWEHNTCYSFFSLEESITKTNRLIDLREKYEKMVNMSIGIPPPYSTAMYIAIRFERKKLEMLNEKFYRGKMGWQPIKDIKELPFNKPIMLCQYNSRPSNVFAVLPYSYHFYNGGEYSMLENLLEFIKKIDSSFETDSGFVNRGQITHWCLIKEPIITEEMRNEENM